MEQARIVQHLGSEYWHVYVGDVCWFGPESYELASQVAWHINHPEAERPERPAEPWEIALSIRNALNKEKHMDEELKVTRERKDEELKVTKERVLAAAEKCGDAKRILKELFPEAFKPATPVYAQVRERSIGTEFALIDGNNLVAERRNEGNYAGALYLNSIYNHSIVQDNRGLMVLVSTRKPGY